MTPSSKTYLEILRARRSDVLKMLDGLNGDALNWRPLTNETNSLYVLALHSLGAERKWIHEIVGGEKIERDRDAELRAHGEDVQALRAMYDAAAKRSEDILARLTESDLETLRPAMRAGEQSVRWCILHILEHYNEHLGQMALTRQLWENRHARPHEI